ncbi:MAG: TolC family protein [Lewinella sp.]|nr:TolC family protein [Lewinella sp.]
MIRLFSTIVLLTASLASLSGQEVWSLQRCVQYALDNNLQIQQAEVTARNAELDVSFNQFSRLPNLSASVSGGYQFGRTIDPTTNAFNNTSIGFNSFQLSAGATVFSGGRINNSIKQSQFSQRAARLDAQDTRQTIALSVATTFLNVLLAEEQLANAQTQLQLSRQQLERTNRLIAAGSLPANNRLDLEAQVARNEQLVVEGQNSVDMAYLNLKQLMQLDPQQAIRIDRPDLAVNDADLLQQFEVETVYNAALQNQPSVEAAQLRYASAEAGEKVAQAGYYPTLNVFGSLSSNYSSVSRDISNPNTDNAQLVESSPTPVNINGEPATVTFFQIEGITYPTTPYFDQINENFGQSLGVSLSIPIYSNHRNNISMERARLNTLSAQVQSQQVQDQLKADVQQAVTAFRAARNSYLAAQRSLESAQAAFDDAQRRFDLGAIGSFEYNDSVDNLDLARVEMTRAKYQFLFNLKVVEFYLGQPLQF